MNIEKMNKLHQKITQENGNSVQKELTVTYLIPQFIIFFFLERLADGLIFQPSILRSFFRELRHEMRSITLLYQTVLTAMLGPYEGDKAKKMSRLIIKTGINKNNNGGGDNGGKTTGNRRRERASRTMTRIDFNIKIHTSLKTLRRFLVMLTMFIVRINSFEDEEDHPLEFDFVLSWCGVGKYGEVCVFEKSGRKY